MHDARLQTHIAALESVVLADTCFAERMAALDDLDFAAESLPPAAHDPLAQRISALAARIAALNAELFQRTRANITAGRVDSTAFRCLLDSAVPPNYRAERGYDALDGLVYGILGAELLPQPTVALEPTLVHLEAVPARIILDLVDNVALNADDVFYDIGSGLGQVVLLVGLLSAAQVKGVEIEPAYCAVARACAQALNVTATFVEADARKMRLDDGTVFFMFTPFLYTPLEIVLARLEQVSRQHAIMLCTYGPCTPVVAREAWLRNIYGTIADERALAIFTSE